MTSCKVFKMVVTSRDEKLLEVKLAKYAQRKMKI